MVSRRLGARVANMRRRGEVKFGEPQVEAEPDEMEEYNTLMLEEIELREKREQDDLKVAKTLIGVRKKESVRRHKSVQTCKTCDEAQAWSRLARKMEEDFLVKYHVHAASWRKYIGKGERLLLEIHTINTAEPKVTAKFCWKTSSASAHHC